MSPAGPNPIRHREPAGEPPSDPGAGGELEALRAEVAALAGRVRDLERDQSGVRRLLGGLAARVKVLEAVPGVRRALRAVVRRRVQLEARPRGGMQDVDAAAGRWRSAGVDADFELVPRAGRYPAGWVRLELALETDVAGVRPPVLLVFRGDGYPDPWPIRLPWPEEGMIRAIVNLDAPVRRLRLDPLDRPGTLRLGPLRVQEVGKVEMVLRLLAPGVGAALRRPRTLAGLVAGAVDDVRHGGLQAFKDRLVASSHVDGDAVRYAEWIARFDILTAADRAAIARRIDALPRRPRFSIVMPVHDTPERWLQRAIDSVRAQLYPDWELCVADDASSAPHVRRVLQRAAAADARIRPVFRSVNGYIAAASNSALEIARGEFVALLDSDDELAPHALYLVAEELAAHPDADLVYSDEDKIDARGRRSSPYCKPEWNPDLLLSQNYFCHLGVYRTALVRAVGGFRPETDGSQDYDLVLRCAARTRPERIRHVPWVLYHWRSIPGSGAADVRAKACAQPAAERALRDHLAATGVAATVSGARFPTTYRVRYPLPAVPPLVTVIVPTRDEVVLLRRCLESVWGRTTYPRFETLVVDNQSRDPATVAYLASLAARPATRVVPYERPFNYSAINNLAVREARGEVVCLLNNDTEVIAPEWLDELASQALRPEIGVVGARLLYADGTVQHAGVVTGLNGVAGHAQAGIPRDDPGYFGQAHLVRVVSAVTGACLAVRREVFERVGGLDEEHLPIAFNDIDFCLRVEEAGFRNLWTPYAELYHHESASRGYEDTPAKQERFRGEVAYMIQRWGARLAGDPCFSPNLSLASERVTLAWPPRRRAPWTPSGD